MYPLYEARVYQKKKNPSDKISSVRAIPSRHLGRHGVGWLHKRLASEHKVVLLAFEQNTRVERAYTLRYSCVQVREPFVRM